MSLETIFGIFDELCGSFSEAFLYEEEDIPMLIL